MTSPTIVSRYFRWLGPIASAAAWVLLLVGTASVRDALPTPVRLLWAIRSAGRWGNNTPEYVQIGADSLVDFFLRHAVPLLCVSLIGAVAWRRWPSAAPLVAMIPAIVSVWMATLYGLSLRVALGEFDDRYYAIGLASVAIWLGLFVLLVVLPALPGAVHTFRLAGIRDEVLRARNRERRRLARAARRARSRR